jgi:hypothetical protein
MQFFKTAVILAFASATFAAITPAKRGGGGGGGPNWCEDPALINVACGEGWCCEGLICALGDVRIRFT